MECIVCEVCGKASDPSRLLLCDDCDISYHTYCLDPPLQTVPKGGWKCKWCVGLGGSLFGGGEGSALSLLPTPPPGACAACSAGRLLLVFTASGRTTTRTARPAPASSSAPSAARSTWRTTCSSSAGTAIGEPQGLGKGGCSPLGRRTHRGLAVVLGFRAPWSNFGAAQVWALSVRPAVVLGSRPKDFCSWGGFWVLRGAAGPAQDHPDGGSLGFFFVDLVIFGVIGARDGSPLSAGGCTRRATASSRRRRWSRRLMKASTAAPASPTWSNQPVSTRGGGPREVWGLL